jgi:uncharacterized membrane protein YedE/YeeE
MNSSRKQILAGGLAGLLFGLGLVLSGMTDPNKVLGFLDMFGAWDPSLVFVMVGAIGVYAVGYRVIVKRSHPLFARAFALPMLREIDAKLVVGAGIFGVGWGLGGYCPGPALVSLASLGAGVIVFVLGLALGTLLTVKLTAAASQPGAAREAPAQ